MTDSMKFGPEWIRNLSSEPFSNRSSSFIPKAQSVEKRISKSVKPQMECSEFVKNPDEDLNYTKEEMLSFFDKKKINTPKDLKKYANLYIENIQVPLALDKTERKMTNNLDSYSHYNNWQSNRVHTRNHRTISNRNLYNANSGASGFNNSTTHGSITSGNGHYNNSGTTGRTMRSNYNSHSSNWNGSATNDWSDNNTSRSGKYENFGENWRHKSNWRHERFEHHNNSNVQNKWTRWRSDSDNSNDKSKKNHWSNDGNGNGNGNVVKAGGGKASLNKLNQHEMESKVPEWATENTTRINGSFDADGSFHQLAESHSPSPVYTDANNVNVSEEVTAVTITAVTSGDKLSQIIKNTIESESLKTMRDKQQPISELSKITRPEFDHENRLKEVANDLVSTLKLDEDTVTSNSNTFSDLFEFKNQLNSTSSAIPVIHNQNPLFQTTSKLPPPPPNLNIMQPPLQLQPPTNSFLEDKWYYLDPQGDVQGPFSTIEMSDWYRAGYFSLNLHVRRHSDNVFMPLQELVKINPQFPFHQQKLPPAVTTAAGLPPVFNTSFLAHFSAVATAMAAANDFSNNTNTIPPGAYVVNSSEIIQNDSSKNFVNTYIHNQKKFMEQFAFLQQQAVNTTPIFPSMPQNGSLPSTNYLMNLMNQPQLPSIFPTMTSSNLNPLTFLQTQKEADLIDALKNFNTAVLVPDGSNSIEKSTPINDTVQPLIDTLPTLTNNSSPITENVILSTSEPFCTFEDKMAISSSSPSPSSLVILSSLKKKKEKKNKSLEDENIIYYNNNMADIKTTRIKTTSVNESPAKSKKQKNELNLNEKQKIVQSELFRTEKIEKPKLKKNLLCDELKNSMTDLKLDSSLIINKPKSAKLNDNLVLNNGADELKKSYGIVWSKVNKIVTPLTEIQKNEQQEEKKRQIERKKTESSVIVEEEKSMGWTKLPLNTNKRAMSLKEIQAEQKKIQSQNAKIKQQAAAISVASFVPSNNKQGAWANPLTAAELLKLATSSSKNNNEVTKPAKKEPISSHKNLPSGFWSCNATSLPPSSSLITNTVKENEKKQNSSKKMSEFKDNRTEFEEWCVKLLLQVTGNDSKGVDIPELIKILIEVESANDVRDYVVNFFGEKKGVNHFITQFLERKRKLLQRRDNSKSYVDDMLAPAQAILPNEIKTKKNKKSMNKVQTTELEVRAVTNKSNMKKGHSVWKN